jgi:hypothetical protein
MLTQFGRRPRSEGVHSRCAPRGQHIGILRVYKLTATKRQRTKTEMRTPIWPAPLSKFTRRWVSFARQRDTPNNRCQDDTVTSGLLRVSNITRLPVWLACVKYLSQGSQETQQDMFHGESTNVVMVGAAPKLGREDCPNDASAERGFH